MKKIMRLFMSLIGIAAFVFALSSCSFITNKNDRYDNANLYTAGGATLSAENIRSIDIDWIGGSITVSPSSSDKIAFSEITEETDENYLLHYAVIGGELKIKFQKSGVTNKQNFSKKLTIELPESVVFTEIDLDSVAGDIFVRSGKANALKVDSVSGDVYVSPAVSDFIEIDVVTGNVVVEAEEERGYRVRFDAVTGTVFNPVHAEITKVDDDTIYTYGDGAVSIEVDIVTGRLSLVPPSAESAA